jgi:hypothetical protein
MALIACLNLLVVFLSILNVMIPIPMRTIAEVRHYTALSASIEGQAARQETAVWHRQPDVTSVTGCEASKWYDSQRPESGWRS